MPKQWKERKVTMTAAFAIRDLERLQRVVSQLNEDPKGLHTEGMAASGRDITMSSMIAFMVASELSCYEEMLGFDE